jgi:beta-glucosidase-like glycosyl hydrolase
MTTPNVDEAVSRMLLIMEALREANDPKRNERRKTRNKRKKAAQKRRAAQ